MKADPAPGAQPSTERAPLADPLGHWRRAVVHGPGLAGVETLPALLPGLALLRPGQGLRQGADGVLAWGRKPSAQRAEAWARQQQLPLVRLEDGFMRSLGLGDEPPLAVVVDDVGIYYDARSPSRLDALAARLLSPAELARGQALRAQWCAQRVSKYNHARERPDLVQPGDVLVVDQTWGDASIAYGAAAPPSFQRMLEAALDEHPHARILLKVHPDVLAGRKRGHFHPEKLSRGAAQRVRWLAQACHPAGLLAGVQAVYVVTSQMGFEALLWGRPVRCFGLPFYAGRGLTQDELPAPAWRGPTSLPALTHAALVDYARYLHPETGQPCPPETLMAWLGLQRQQRERFAPELYAVGFSPWKRPIVRSFLAGSQVKFIGPGDDLPPQASLVLWGLRRLPPNARRQAPAQVIRLEDGFLRSVGLGADLVRPLSWVLDGQGLYYNASQPSALEQLLAQAQFPPELCERARALRERVLASGLTKYNVGQQVWQRPQTQRRIVLVVGQVESDAAIRHGAPQIHTNMGLLRAVRQRCPRAYLLYKPHPDVLAKLRASGQGEQQAQAWCDHIVLDVAMDQLLREVDEVHVLTSLAGFEALLRGKPVVTWGQPFYAGWGLTQDCCVQPTRRGRLLSLDELTAAVLILYPTYVSRRTGHFTTPENALDELLHWREQERKQGGPGLGRRVTRLALQWAGALRRLFSPKVPP